MTLKVSRKKCMSPDRLSSQSVWKELRKNKGVYLLALPGIIFFLLFNYLPMFGLVVAFKDYRIRDGIFGSPWNGFENFKFFFESGHAWRVTRNTLILNLLFISTATFFQMFFAILLNEVRNKYFKKITQSITFLPYFMSWIVVSVIVAGFLESGTGVLYQLAERLDMTPVQFYSEPKLWPFILTLLYNWKWIGYGMVLFLAAIAGMDNACFEAAEIDGASRFQQIIYIIVPLLKPTVIILVLLAVGKIFYGDFGMIYGLLGDNGMLFSTTDVIDTYVYRALRHTSNIGMSAAVGLYQSVMGFVLVMLSNKLAKRFDPDSALF